MTIDTKTDPTAEPPVRVLYIAGIGRSGSTLLDRMLGSLDGFVAVGEAMHVFGRGIHQDERCACGARFSDCDVWGRVLEDFRRRNGEDPAALDRLRHRLTEGPGLLGPFLPWQPPALRRRIDTLRTVVGRTYRALGRATGWRVVVDSSKSPAYARILIGAPGVEVWILHLVRDSRGVTFSLAKRRRRPGTDRPEELLDRRSAGTGSLLWSGANLLTESLAGRAEGYLRVRYGDFVREPERAARRVIELMGERDGDGCTEALRGRTVTLNPQHVLSGNLVRGRTGAVELREDLEWLRSMPAGRRWLVGALTFPLLRRYGYPLRSPRPPTDGAAPVRAATQPATR